jgi:hypothetical protein
LKKEKILVLILATLLIGISSVGFLTTVTPKTNEILYLGPEAIDLSPEDLGEDEMAIRREAALVGPGVATGASPIGEPANVGDEFVVTVSDDGLGIDYDETFKVVYEGVNSLFLVTMDAYNSFLIDGVYHFANPLGDDSEPWLRTEDIITPDQLVYMMGQFDGNIYPTVTTIYGAPLPRGDEGQKVWILLFNIRDDAYYDPDAESYAAGYFSADTSATQNKNIIHIDTYYWADRVGPGVGRPYLYEGIIAHEFEHLVHFDADPDEPSWVDEGCADLAGFFCGYGHFDGHIYYYFAYHPMVSLTFWGGGLEDYGCSYLFMLYMYEHFGGAAFVSALVAEQANGIEGIELTLAAFGYSQTFDEIFDAWTIANYFDLYGKYGYSTLEVGGADTRYRTIESFLLNNWWGEPSLAPFDVSSDWFFGIEPQPYTAHYFRSNTNGMGKISIDGDDVSGTFPYSGNYEWYSDANAWAWRSFYQTFDIPAGGATLNFMTLFEIEWNWDYGYVEVYDHDTMQWTTLNDPAVVMYDDYFDPYGMVDFVGHAQDNPNCPNGREPTDYEAAGNWYGFSGYSDGWIPVSMDLSPFAGHTIDLYFTTWQDGAFTLQMMYVDDISIPEIGFTDDVETGEDGWTSTGWYVTTGILDNSFGVTTVSVKTTTWWYYTFTTYAFNRMVVNPITETGTMYVMPIPVGSGMHVTIVSNHAPHILTSHYELSVGTFSWWYFQ